MQEQPDIDAPRFTPGADFHVGRNDTLRVAVSKPPVALAPSLADDSHAFDIFHTSIQGYSIRHAAELVASLKLLKSMPAIVCLGETFLEKNTENIELEGYVVVARRDKDDGQICGGVIAFARCDVAANVTQVHRSAEAECFWLVIHTDQGPYLLGAWYRPPDPCEAQTISTLEAEWLEHCNAALGTVIVGDINVHHIGWLRYSARNSCEGAALHTFCDAYGLRQLVREPT